MLQFILVLGCVLIHPISSAPVGNENQFPVGTIIAWKPRDEFDNLVPCGWKLCDGKMIEDVTSPLFGYRTPSLNTDQLFLRGTLDENSLGRIEMDTIPQHGHNSVGHTHEDLGHTHVDNGHGHDLKVQIPFPVLQQGSEHGDGVGSPKWATAGHYPPFSYDKLPLSKANLQNGHSKLTEAHAKLSGVVNGRAAEETRPINVKYPYIIKVGEANSRGTHGNDIHSIVGWLPNNQQSKPMPWKLSVSLNNVGAFIRGGSLENAGQFQMDSMKDHSHQDLGHVHKDIGHTHEDEGHSHEIELKGGNTEVYDVLRPGDVWGDGDGGPHFGSVIDMDGYFDIGHANIQVSRANVQSGKENIGNVIDTSSGTETRPNNLHVEWIEGNTNLTPESFPIGSIVAWLPLKQSSKMDDLPDGWVECSGKDGITPNINGQNLFLRGSDTESAGIVEDFQLQEHKHNDLGHSHTDTGHTHVDLGHNAGVYEILIPGDNLGDENGSPNFAVDGIIDILKLHPSKANLKFSKANIDVSWANIKDVTNAKTSEEVRPKNMAVTFIMRIY